MHDRIRGLTCGLFLLAATQGSLGENHVADTNLDQRITTAEVQSYWASGLGAMTAEEKRAEVEWQQAEFLWRNGENYLNEAGLEAPFCALPAAVGNWASLSNRYARGLEIIEVLTAVSPVTFTGEYQIPGSAAWVDLDCKRESDGRLRMIVPYVPTQWLEDSRRITVRFRLDGVLHQGGEILLREIDRTDFNFPSYYEQIIKSINLMAGTQGIDLDGPVAELRAGRVVSDPVAHHFATARFSAEFNRDVILTLRDSGASGAAIYEMNEELLHLIIPDADKAELARTAEERSATGVVTPKEAPNKDGPSLFFGCAPIKDSIDLSLETMERCRLEEKKSLGDQLKELTGLDEASEYLDKLGEKVTELGDKTSKKYITKGDAGSKHIAGLPAFALSASYELYNYREAWQKDQLPKFVERYEYEVVDEEIRGRGFLYEDGKGGAKECVKAKLEVYVHVKGKGFDSAKFLRDKIPPASAGIPPVISGTPLFGNIVEKLVDSGQKAALDTAEAALRDDLMIRPCRWPEDSTAKGIKLRSEDQFLVTTVAGSAIRKASEAAGDKKDPRFSAAMVGKGPLRVSLQDKETAGKGNFLCLEPYSGFFSFEVRPIRVEFTPVGYTVDDVDEMLTMLVSLEDSHDVDKLEWDFRDKDGHYLGTLDEEDDRVTLVLPHPTNSGDKFHTLRIDPPDDLELYPLTVEAVSQAKGCLRDLEAAPKRRGSALIHYQAKAFHIDPNRTCLALNSTTELEAIPADPSNTLEIEWEVVSGDATILKTGPATANLMVGDTRGEEVEVKATGNDTFESFAYFSVGPCFEQVSLTSFFPEELIRNPIVGVAYDNSEVMGALSFGESGGIASSEIFPLGSEGISESYNPGIDLVFGMGAVRNTVTEVELIDPERKLIAVDASYKGLFYTTFNYKRPGIFEPIYRETVGGTFFDDFDLSDGSYFDGPLMPTKMIWTPDGLCVDVTFEQDLSPPGGDGSLSAAWAVVNGTKLEEFTDGDTARMVARFANNEFSPIVEVIVSGTVRDGDLVDSYFLKGVTQQRVIFSVGETRFKAVQEEDSPLLCGGWVGGPDFLGFILDDCCGFINLSNSSEPEYRGLARQNTALALMVDNGEGLQSAFSLTFNTDESLPYCSELRRLKMETPDPDPYEEEDDPMEPEETPEALKDDFKNSPNPEDDTQFPSVEGSEIIAGGGGSVAIDPEPSTFRYPFTNLLGLEGIKLGTFVRNTGVRLATETVVSQGSLDYFGGLVRIAGVTRLSSSTGSGYLIERTDPDTGERLVDFWEIDPVDGLLIARTLISDPLSDFSVMGSGDFDGDGTIDLLGGSDSAPFGGLTIRKGSAAGFAAAVPFYANAPGDSLRSAAVVSASNQVFVSGLDLGKNALNIHRLSSAGALVSTHAIVGLDGSTVSLKAFTDADADGIPDLILHSPVLEHFVVIYLKADGTERERQNYEVPQFSTLPGSQF